MAELGAGRCSWGRKESGTTERLHFTLSGLDVHQACSFRSFRPLFICRLSEKPSLTVLCKIGLALYFLSPLPCLFFCMPLSRFLFLYYLFPLTKISLLRSGTPLLIAVCSVLGQHLASIWLSINIYLFKLFITLFFSFFFKEKSCILI